MRWLVRLVIVALVLLVVPILLLSFFLDSAASRAASYALGVETSMNLVLRPLLGRVSIFGLNVANPPGFESRRFLGLDGGRFELELRTLTGDRVRAPLLRLEGIEVSLERRGGKYNYDAILANLRRFESGDAGDAAPTGDQAGGKQFVIGQLEILDVVANVDVVEMIGDRGQLSVEIPELRLRDVGGQQGISLAELSNIVVKTILGAVAKQGVGLPQELTSALRGDLRGLRGVAFEVGGAVGSQAAETVVQQLDDAVGEQAAGALRNLGGMLRRGEEK